MRLEQNEDETGELQGQGDSALRGSVSQWRRPAPHPAEEEDAGSASNRCVHQTPDTPKCSLSCQGKGTRREGRKQKDEKRP